MTTTTTTFDEQVEKLRRSRDSAREARKDPQFFSTYDPDWLDAYQSHVLRWAHCAPEGARLLPAPMQGWDGTPFTSREQQGPQSILVNPAYRQAIEKMYGEHPVERALRIWKANHEEQTA